jgi:hypothetical protein
LSKKYSKLWVFGDSYATPGYCVEPKDSFWGLTASLLSANEILNYSWPGNSLDSIVHVLISEQNQYDWENDFFIIGVPPLARLTVVSKDDKKITTAHKINSTSWQHDTFGVLCHHGMENISGYMDKHFAIYEDSTWTQTQAMRSIFLLNAWLDSKNANYLIVNLSVDFGQDYSSVGNFLMSNCLAHPRNLLFCDGYYSVNLTINAPVDFEQYGWQGHHGAAGNKHFFEKSILPILEKNKLI